MTASPFDFGGLLHPLGRTAFFSTYWEKAHLYVQRGEPDYYRALPPGFASNSDVKADLLQGMKEALERLRNEADLGRHLYSIGFLSLI